MAAVKVIGRILSLGFPLPGPQVDNYSFLSAPSFFDYDAIVVDMAALSSLLEGVINGSAEATTFADQPVRNDDTADRAASLAEILLRRRDEAAKLVENGGVIVCFAHPETMHRGISGLDAVGDYYWLPAANGGDFDAALVCPADGTQADIVDYQHPLAAFVHRQLSNLTYRAFIDVDHVPGLAAGGGVFVCSKGGAPIGVELPPVASGRVLLLPALRAIPSGDDRYVMSDDLQAGIRRALGAEAPGREPAWLDSFALPGLDDRSAALAAAQQASAGTQAALDDARRSYEELARFRRLLWQEGSVGLDATVLDALRLIGIAVYASDPNAVELRIDGTPVLLEIEASEHDIGMAPHYRLRQRIERAIERRGQATRGLLIVNGRRLSPPGERGGGISDALRLAADTMRYCIAPTSTLFDAVSAHFRGDDAAVAAYRSRLVTHNGLLE